MAHSIVSRSFAVSLATALVLGLSSPAAAADPVPEGRTPVGELSPSGLAHQEVLRIDPDGLGPSRNHDIVIDGWVDAAKPRTIAGVKMWWLDRDKGGERSPFGKAVRRTVDIDYDRASDNAWRVAIRHGKRAWAFDIELDEKGRLQAYADIVAKDGTVIEHCRALRSRLVARRALGIPSGLETLEVVCIDSNGKRQRGRMR
jgi:hypothetical protein